MTILQLELVRSGYGDGSRRGARAIVDDLSLTVGEAQIVVIIGRNGAGKSSLLKVISGVLPLWSGSLKFLGCDIGAMDTVQRIGLGISFVPQGNRVFTELTVVDNLLIRSRTAKVRMRRFEVVEQACREFPRLRQLLRRRAGLLSGGERQMLAMAGALMLSPRLLLLDEPSLGLTEGAAEQMLQTVQRLRKENGLTVMIVEQRLSQVMKIADEFYALKEGRVWKHGEPKDIDSDEARRQLLM